MYFCIFHNWCSLQSQSWLYDSKQVPLNIIFNWLGFANYTRKIIQQLLTIYQGVLITYFNFSMKYWRNWWHVFKNNSHCFYGMKYWRNWWHSSILQNINSSFAAFNKISTNPNPIAGQKPSKKKLVNQFKASTYIIVVVSSFRWNIFNLSFKEFGNVKKNGEYKNRKQVLGHSFLYSIYVVHILKIKLTRPVLE